MKDLFGAPYSNETITWRPEPASRGTWTIITTSVITLVLCVWTSIHLNVPCQRETKWVRCARRLKWILIGLFIPEILVSTAIDQYVLARRISKEAEKVFGGQGHDEEGQRPERRHPWTMTHSYWALMGGIAVDGSDPSTRIIPESTKALFTPSGVSMLLHYEPELIPDISEQEINDKSKGGSWTKFIACAQASWFCISCIGRVGQKLPLSQLEINTLAHAMCTIVVYIMWWKKPLDVEVPVLITDRRVRPLLAYCWMASAASAPPALTKEQEKAYARIQPQKAKRAIFRVDKAPEFEAIRLSPDDSNSDPWLNTMARASNSTYGLGTTTATTPGKLTVTATESLLDTGFYTNTSSKRWEVKVMHKVSSGGGPCGGNTSREELVDTICFQPVFHLIEHDVERWICASDALNKYQLKRPERDQNLVTVTGVPESIARDTRGYVRILKAEGVNLVKKARTWGGFVISGAVYGGVHSMAWNSMFPAADELSFWRFSTIVIFGLSLGIATWMLAVSIKHHLSFHGTLKRLIICPPAVWTSSSRLNNVLMFSKAIALKIWPFVWFFVKVPVIFAGSLFALFYLLGRGYIVWESFRTVFSQPPEVYEVMQWTQYLPHIT
ncbi:hypothetical protein QBC43DRAFT_299378 [Cladorrhinum sp. PSN259]|nr:hypothetical protein QBC43DRAFT_299378 [Cladorrhinum sp. PSN259]